MEREIAGYVADGDVKVLLMRQSVDLNRLDYSAGAGNVDEQEDIKVAVILPAYNEEQTVGPTIRALHSAIPAAHLWVVNNNSNDDTGKIAHAVLDELNAKGGVLFEPRRGKGNAVRRAFHEVDADVYVLIDADSTYPAARMEDLIRPIIDGRADMVVGDRHSKGYYKRENKRLLHNFGNRAVQSLVNRLFNTSLVDIMSGYRAFNRMFVKNYPILVEGFEIETDMTLHALDKKFRIVEVPIEYKDRPPGSFSKLNTFNDGYRVISTLVRILRHYRPLSFFGGVGLFLAFAGLLAAAPVFDDWVRHHYIYHVPLAILATGIETVALLLFAVGLILDSIADQGKRNFERELLRKS
jgi:glycosyltransferase involved in cell wall biosynthesis